MSFPIAFPVRLGVPLSRVDPRWKLAALVAAGAAVGTLRTLGPASAAVAGALAIVALARIPPRWYATRVGTVIFFLAMFLVFLPLENRGGEERLQVGPLSLSPRGMMLSVVLLLKAVALMSLVLAAATTAPVDAQLKALQALCVPGLLVHLIALTVRYLAVLLDEFAKIRIALRARGHRHRLTLGNLRTIGQVWGTLLVRAAARAERVAQALRCRGFDGDFHALTEFHTRVIDVAFFVLVMAAAAGLLGWDFLAR
jgi:cobalt/nickel transport system permease protein